MRKEQRIIRFASLLFYGLPFLALAQTGNPADPTLETHRAATEACIAETTEALEEKGVVPSEESSQYDTAFDEAYASCMAEKGLPAEPIGSGEEGLPPETDKQ